MYENAQQDNAKMAAGTPGRTTAMWFANENDRLLEQLEGTIDEKLAMVLPRPGPASPPNAVAQSSPVTESELSSKLLRQNERLQYLIRRIQSVDL